MSSNLYFPTDGEYIPDPFSIYAHYYHTHDCPNPCRKYHISSDIDSAKKIAESVLPYLASRKIHHKVVKNQPLLIQQSTGDQAGKFITVYMSANMEHVNVIIRAVGTLLATLKHEHSIKPCPTVPKSRRYAHLFMEQPLDDNLFIYGGFVCNPME